MSGIFPKLIQHCPDPEIRKGIGKVARKLLGIVKLYIFGNVLQLDVYLSKLQWYAKVL